jgi:hypothetical protein
VTGPAALARVTVWGELPAERRLPGVLRVLVAGQHAGAVQHDVDRGWIAQWYTASQRDRYTVYPSAESAIRAVPASGFARRLGARTATRLTYSDEARRLLARHGVVVAS